MDTHTQNNTLDDGAAASALNQLKNALQREMGREMEIVSLIELAPLLVEAILRDPTSGTRYFARCYRVPRERHGQAFQLWREHAATLNAAFKHLPQKAQGLKNIGGCLVYLAAEVPGLDLERYLALTGPLRPELAVRFCVQLVRSLEKLAEFKCHHLRIHPAQITITPEGLPVLRWIGLEPFETALATALELQGLMDAAYASPEQLNDSSTSAATDIYQLGLLLYRMVSGAPPYQGGYTSVRDGHLTRPLPNPQAKNSAVTTGFNRVLIRALAKEPGQRFDNLQEFRTALAYLQPSVERAESIGVTDVRALKLKDKDKAKITQLLSEAQDQLVKEDFQTALRTIDNVFVMVGWHGEAARLHQQIWETMYGATVKKFYDAANQAWTARNGAEALARLQNCLSFMPRFKPALKLQAEIFQSLGEASPALPLAIDAKAFLGKAVEVKAEAPALAQLLWTQVLLLPLPEEIKARSDLQFQKQLAQRGLKGLPSELFEALVVAPTPARVQPPAADIEIGESVEDFFEKEHLPPVAAAPPPPPPPPSTPVMKIRTEKPELTTLNGEKPPTDQDLLPPAAPAKPKRGLGFKLALAGAALVVLALGAFWGVSMAKTRSLAKKAYVAAETAEHEGDWDKALQLWDAAAAQFPGYSDTVKRLDLMKQQIQQRKYEIHHRIEAVREQMANLSVFEPNLTGKTVLDLLTELNRMDSAHPEVVELMNQVRTSELERANLLFDSQNIVEAQANYQKLVSNNVFFRDETLESKLQTWVENRMVLPGLEKLAQAVKRQDWTEARKVSDELNEVMTDKTRLDQIWNTAWESYAAQREAAKQSGKQSVELVALNAMVLIRPGDEELVASRDRLSRDINLAKINELEKNLNDAKRKESRGQMISLSRKLLELDSKNPVATQTLTEIQRDLTRQIGNLKTANPREALQLYSDLLLLPNGKSFRVDQQALRDHIAQFDSGASALKRDDGQDYERHKEAINTFLGRFPDMSNDGHYKTLKVLIDDLEADNQRLQEVLRWEQKPSNSSSYTAVVDYLQKNRNLKFSYGRNKVQDLIAQYEDKIKRYDGNVKLVILKAMKLPLAKGNLFSSVTSHCVLKAGGQTFKSESAKGENPNFNQICNFKNKPGTPLVFTLFENKGKQVREIGTITLNTLPDNQNNLVLKPDSGDWSLIVNVSRER